MKKKPFGPDLFREILTDLYNEIPSDEEVAELEEILLTYAEVRGIAPDSNLKKNIMSQIFALESSAAKNNLITLENVPLLQPTDDYRIWAAAVSAIAAPEDLENIHLHAIRSDETVEMFVAWVKEEVPLEVHHDILESFILLEGSCACKIWDTAGNERVVHLETGDFIAFELGEDHNILITSPQPVKAILQWLKVAA